MRICLFVFSFFVAVATHAQSPSTSLRAYLLNFESRFERAASQETVSRQPLNLGIGYHSARYSLLAAYSRFAEDTGNATSSFVRTYQDLLVWLRYHALSLQNRDRSLRTNIYLGAGAGAYQEQVETIFSGVSRVDKGNAKFISGGALGAEFSLGVNRHFGLVGALEGRILMSADFDPNPMWSAVVRLGVAFPL